MSNVLIENLDENDAISVDVSRGGQLLNTFAIEAGKARNLAVGGNQSLLVTAGEAADETAPDAAEDIPLGADVSDAPIHPSEATGDMPEEGCNELAADETAPDAAGAVEGPSESAGLVQGSVSSDGPSGGIPLLDSFTNESDKKEDLSGRSDLNPFGQGQES